jgi:hypothetical protein
MVLMKIRGLLAGLLVAVTLGACTRSATAPDAPRTPVVSTPLADEVPPPPPDTTTTTERGGGALGSGH